MVTVELPPYSDVKVIRSTRSACRRCAVNTACKFVKSSVEPGELERTTVNGFQRIIVIMFGAGTLCMTRLIGEQAFGYSALLMSTLVNVIACAHA